MKLLMINVDLGKGLPEYADKNIEHNRWFFEKTFVIDAHTYEYLKKEMFLDPRVASMFKLPNGRNQFDVVRTWWASKNPEWVYADTDIKILKPLEVDEDKPAFGRAKVGLDGCIFYSGRDGQYWNSMLEQMYYFTPTQCFPQIKHIPQDWDNVIEPEYFEHSKA